MEKVHPITEITTIKAIGMSLERSENPVYGLLWTAALYLGLRTNDLLKLKMEAFLEPKKKGFEVKKYLETTIQKSKKRISILIHLELAKAIKKHIASLDRPIDLNEFMFPADESPFQRMHRGNVPRVWTRAAKKIGHDKPVSGHVARKSFGFHAFNRGVRIEYLMDLFGHASPSVTRIYCGLSQRNMDDAIRMLDFT